MREVRNYFSNEVWKFIASHARYTTDVNDPTIDLNTDDDMIKICDNVRFQYLVGDIIVKYYSTSVIFNYYGSKITAISVFVNADEYPVKVDLDYAEDKTMRDLVFIGKNAIKSAR